MEDTAKKSEAYEASRLMVTALFLDAVKWDVIKQCTEPVLTLQFSETMHKVRSVE